MTQWIRWISSAPESIVPSLFLTVPHSGERVPSEASWLNSVPHDVLLTDIDRYVDRLYLPVAQSLALPLLSTEIHRYCADLNRYPDDVDASTVEGALEPSGKFKKGFIWAETTQGVPLLSRPILSETHQSLVRHYHDPFHHLIESAATAWKKLNPARPLFHLDCHSMPSVGTFAHSDAGARRPDVVVSDWEGRSASPFFRDLTLHALQNAGLSVSLNHPYKGGRITQRYGRPEFGHETLQIELNRDLYMEEQGDRPLKSGANTGFSLLQQRLQRAIEEIVKKLPPTTP